MLDSLPLPLPPPPLRIYIKRELPQAPSSRKVGIMSIEKGISTNSRPMPIVSSSDEDEASLVSSSPDHLLDTFDVNLSSIVDYSYDNAGICLSKSSSSTTTSSSKYYNDGVSLFMLGDYSEKGHFLPSTNIIRNEVLEAYDITSSLDDDCNNEHEVQIGNKQEKCIAFRCIYCKHIAPPTKRAAMAEIFPKVSLIYFLIFSRDTCFCLAYFSSILLSNSDSDRDLSHILLQILTIY